MKTRHIIAASIISALLVASAGASIYTVYREDIGKIIFPSYSTIIPPDSPLRNSVQQGECNGGFSPNPCVGAIPEPGTLWLMLPFWAGLFWCRRKSLW